MKRFLPLLLALLLLTGCGAGQPSVEKQEKTVYAMDTVMTLTVYPEQNGEDLSPVLDAAESEIRRLDALLSISNEQGDIYRLNHDGTASVTQETGLLVQRALSIAADTDGAFDPTVYPLMELWGFPTEQYRVPTQKELDMAMTAGLRPGDCDAYRFGLERYLAGAGRTGLRRHCQGLHGP